MGELLLLWFFPAAMTLAAVTDLLTMTIPNRLSLAIAAGFGLACLVAGLGLPQTAVHVSAGAAMLVFGFACFAFGWIGGGDAKLFAAAALWFGWERLGEYALVTGLLGGGLTLLILALRQVPLPPALHQGWLLRLHDPKAGVPYGIALAAAAIILYPHTIWFVQAAGH